MSDKFQIINRDTPYLPPSPSPSPREWLPDKHLARFVVEIVNRLDLTELEGLFVQILMIAQTMGLLKLCHVSLDGTKMKSNASKHNALFWRYANQLEAQLRSDVAELLRRA